VTSRVLFRDGLVSSSHERLEKYRPHRDEAVNDRPAVLPFAWNLQASLDMAERLGVDDAVTILSEAKKHTQSVKLAGNASDALAYDGGSLW